MNKDTSAGNRDERRSPSNRQRISNGDERRSPSNRQSNPVFQLVADAPLPTLVDKCAHSVLPYNIDSLRTELHEFQFQGFDLRADVLQNETLFELLKVSIDVFGLVSDLRAATSKLQVALALIRFAVHNAINVKMLIAYMTPLESVLQGMDVDFLELNKHVPYCGPELDDLPYESEYEISNLPRSDESILYQKGSKPIAHVRVTGLEMKREEKSKTLWKKKQRENKIQQMDIQFQAGNFSLDYKRILQIVSLAFAVSKIHTIYDFINPLVWGKMGVGILNPDVAATSNTVQDVIDILIWFRDKVVIAYQKGITAMFDFSNASVQKWNDDVEAEIANTDFSVGMPLARLQRMDRLIEEGERMRAAIKEKEVGGPLFRHIDTAVTRLKQNAALLNSTQSGTRRAPISVFFHGMSGQGKSSVVSLTKLAVMARLGLDAKSGTYDVPLATAHDNGLARGTTHINFDDVGVISNKARPLDEDLLKYMRLVNNSPALSNQAALEKKDDLFLNPVLVTISSNLDDLGVLNYFNRPEAVLRRVTLRVRVTAKSQYCKVVDGKPSPALDPNRVDGTNDYWQFDVTRPVLRLQTQGSAVEWERVWSGDSIKDYLELIRSETKTHFAGQDLYIKGAEGMTEYQVCTACDKFISPPYLAACTCDNTIFPDDSASCIGPGKKPFSFIPKLPNLFPSKPVNTPVAPYDDAQSVPSIGTFPDVGAVSLQGHEIATVCLAVGAGAFCALAINRYVDAKITKATTEIEKLAQDQIFAAFDQAQQFRMETVNLLSERADQLLIRAGLEQSPLAPPSIVGSFTAKIFVKAVKERIRRWDKAIYALLASITAVTTGYIAYRAFSALAAPSIQPQGASFPVEVTKSFWAKPEDNITKFTEASKSSSPDLVRSKIDGNTVSISFDADGRTSYCNGVFLSGTVLITTAHSLKMGGVYTISGARGKRTFPMTEENVTIFQEDDIALLSVPVSSYPDITGFILETAPPKLPKVEMRFPESTIRDAESPIVGSLAGPVQYGPSATMHLKVSDERVRAVWTYDPRDKETKSGDCGTPLLVLQGNTVALIGIHCALHVKKGIVSDTKMCFSYRLTRSIVMRYLAQHHARKSTAIDEVAVMTDDAWDEARQNMSAKGFTHFFQDASVSDSDLVMPPIVSRLDGTTPQTVHFVPLNPKCPVSNTYDHLLVPGDPVLGKVEASIRPICSVFPAGVTFRTKVKYRAISDRAVVLGVPRYKIVPYVASMWKLKRRYLISVNSHPLLPAKEFTAAVKAQFHHALTMVDPSDFSWVRPLDLMESVNGIPGVKYLDSIDMSTSMGFPNPGQKREYFSVMYEQGRAVYYPPIEVENEVYRMRDLYLLGLRANPIFSAGIKDAAEKEQKVLEFRNRIIYASPVSFTILMRMYYAPVFKLIQENRYAFGAGPGLNTLSSEWVDLRRYLEVKADKFNDGDYKGYDVSLQGPMLLEQFGMFINIAQATGNYTRDDLQIMWGIAHDVCFAKVNFFGDILEMPINPSGQCGTTHVNGSLNRSLIMCGFAKHSGLPVQDFFKHVTSITYGDDNLFGSRTYPGYDNASLGEYLLPYGIVYTNAQKTDENMPPRTLDWDQEHHVTFVKRGWKYLPEINRDSAAIELATIDAMFHTYMASAKVDETEQWASTVNSLMLMAAEHGLITYKYYRDIVSALTPEVRIFEFDELIESIQSNELEYSTSRRRRNGEVYISRLAQLV